MEQLEFWSVGHLARPSLSPDNGAEWVTLVANWPLGFAELLLSTAPDGSSGKTSMASCQAGEDGILAPLSNRWLTAGMAAPGECWTLSTSESPSDAVACSLSDTLETGDVPQRYFLSATACKGILRRAERRGKKLPEPLRLALESVATTTRNA